MNVTYLFGAGASCHALPMVKNIPTRIGIIADLLDKQDYSLSEIEKFPNSSHTKNETKEILIQDLKWLKTECKKHASIDTLAKKLYILNDFDSLKRLKACFSAYFAIEHFLKPPDPRYDAFFASILKEDSNSFPQDMRILSWNYDLQFEKAFSEYSQSSKLNTNKNILRVHNKFNNRNLSGKDFSIIKLNGSVSLRSSPLREYFFLQDLTNSLSIENLELTIQNYARLRFTNDFYSGLSFAWESSDMRESIALVAANSTVMTEILVVIGYSFPYFNREIDRKIIRSMTSLSKVYIQAPDAQKIAERFTSIRDDIRQIATISDDLDQFIIPYEY